MPTINHPLSPTQLHELKDRLEAERRTLLAEYEQDLERERAIPTDDTGDLVDRAEVAEDREELFAAAEGELDQLQEIDEALRRVSEGSYGLCRAGGEPIALERLRAVPWTRYCAAHQEQLEVAAPHGARRQKLFARASLQEREG